MIANIPVQTLPGYDAALRSHLRDALAPYPNPDGEPFALSFTKSQSGPEGAAYFWTCDADGQNIQAVSLTSANRGQMDRLGGPAYHIDAQIDFMRAIQDLVTARIYINFFDVVCLPQGAILVADGVAWAIKNMARSKGVAADDCVQDAITVLAGADTSMHERLELIQVSESFLNHYLQDEDANHANPETMLGLRVRVQALAEQPA